MGFISLTSASTPRLKTDGRYFVVPSDLYAPIEQGAVLIAKAEHRIEAKKFLVYLMSTPVQQGMREFWPDARASGSLEVMVRDLMVR